MCNIILNGGNGKHKALLDSGSTCTLIKKRSLGRERHKLLPYRKRITAANGDIIPILGMTEASIRLPESNKTVKIKAIVVDDKTNFPGNVLIGMDVLEKGKAVLDFRNKTILIKDDIPTTNTQENKQAEVSKIFDADRGGGVSHCTHISMQRPAEQPMQRPAEQSMQRPAEQPTERLAEQPIEPPAEPPAEQPTEQSAEQAQIPVHIHENIVIPAHCNMVLTVRVKNIPDAEYIVGKSNFNGHKVLLAESMVSSKNGRIPVMLLNTSDTPETITIDTKLTTMEAAGNCEIIPIREDQSAYKYLSTERSKAINKLGKVTPTGKTPVPIKEEEVSCHMPGDVTKDLTTLLNTYRDAIARDGEPPGLTNVTEYEIITKPDSPVVYTRQYRVPHVYQEKLDTAVEEMLAAKVIEPSNSPYNSPLILVKKKDSSMRPCVDFRLLNSITVPFRYPLPIIPEMLQSLKGNKIFSTLDLLSAFWQVPLAPMAKEKTAFTTRKGKFQFTRLPFGLVNAPTVFASLISSVLADMLGVGALVYLDDIVVFSKTVEDHFQRLEDVLCRLQRAGLRLKLSKCAFFKSQIQFLGHQVSEKGIFMDPKRQECIKEFPAPKTAKQVRSFLGMMSYFRTFVPEFSKIAAPLQTLVRANLRFKWEEEHQRSFDCLKDKLLEAPILQYPDFDRQFFLCTDASNDGLGAVLLQEYDDLLLPVSYASRTLNDTEKRYSTTKREALAVTWALRHFRFVVLGYPITVYTDHQPLVCLFQKKLPDGAMGRWAIQCQQYRVKLKYLPGRFNLLADTLSRLSKVEENSVLLESDLQSDFEDAIYLLHEHTGEPDTVNKIEAPVPTTKIPWERETLIEGQRTDVFCQGYIKALKNTQDKYPRNLSLYFVTNDILYYKRYAMRAGIETLHVNVVVPDIFINEIIQLCHDPIYMGHLDYERTLWQLQQRFHFSREYTRVQRYCTSCVQCIRANGQISSKGTFRNAPIPDKPWHRVAIDFVGPLPETEDGNRQLLVATDYLTRFTVLIPLPNRSAQNVARALRRHVFTPFGYPKEMLSDNASEFTGSVITSMCEVFNIKKVECSPYHPRGNSLVERVNQRVIRALRVYLNDGSMSEWDQLLPEISVMINNSYNTNIGDCPQYVLFGYDANVPIFDNPFDTPEVNYRTDDYYAQVAPRLQYIRGVLAETLAGNTEARVARQNVEENTKPRSLELGQRVFARHVVKVGEFKKFSPRFEGPFSVKNKLRHSLYLLEHGGTKHQRRVHIDNILSTRNKYQLPSQVQSTDRPAQETQDGGAQTRSKMIKSHCRLA
jgi:hypothetical protein